MLPRPSPISLLDSAVSPRATNPLQVTGVPLWASLAGGFGAGIAAAAFLATRWPYGLLAVPVLTAWALLLAAWTKRRGSSNPYRSLLPQIGAIAILLVLAVITMFARLP